METPKAVLTFISVLALLGLSGASHPVLDIEGHPVVAGTDYYILSVFRGGAGGGLTLAGENASSCPLNVVQESSDLFRGLPVTFSPVKKEKAIPESTDLNIKFSAVTRCPESTVWRLGALDETTKQQFVTTGGVEGNPGEETVSNWFKIEKYRDHYKLVFCPSVCDTCKVVCGDLGISFGKGMRSLALSDVHHRAHNVYFRRA